MTGYTREQLGRGALRWDDLMPPQWVATMRQAFQQVVATGRTNPYENEYLRKDGSTFWA